MIDILILSFLDLNFKNAFYFKAVVNKMHIVKESSF